MKFREILNFHLLSHSLTIIWGSFGKTDQFKIFREQGNVELVALIKTRLALLGPVPAQTILIEM